MIVAMGVLTACTTPTAPTTGAAPDAVGGGASAGPSHGAAATGGPSSQPTDSPAADGTAGTPTDGSGTASPTQPAKAAGTMTLSFAGDVHFGVFDALPGQLAILAFVVLVACALLAAG